VNPVLAVGVVALGLGGGAFLVSTLPRFRRPGLRERLLPYLGSFKGTRTRLLVTEAPSTFAVLLGPLVEDLARRLQALVGDGGRDAEARLAGSGAPTTVAAFRVQQVTWGLAGLAGGTALGALMVASGRSVSPVAILAAVLAFGVGGVLARDRALTRAVSRRRARATAEFPTFVDMVCIAVTAGESLRGALDLVAHGSTGPIAEETRIALREARAGAMLSTALAERARILGVPVFERFVSAVLAAQERGMPLGDALRAMAFDVREEEKRSVIEAAGRKQVSMLVPVVALILPVAVVFAFFPGVVAIKTLAH
jgi:tight adherence protein C